MAPSTVCILVRHNPPAGFRERALSALAQCDGLIVIDNGSEDTEELDLLETAPGAQIHRNDRNLGIAKALNQGLEAACAMGADYALLLDHDSTLERGGVNHLRAAATGWPDGKTAAAVPRIRYGHPGIACRWPRTANGSRWRFGFVYADKLAAPCEVDLAISSGMLVSVPIWKQLGGFDETLFIDFVDIEYCLRARAAGFRIVAAPKALLFHELGAVSEGKLLRRFAVYPTHHSPLRHYYISRNRVVLARRYARRFPSWLCYECLGSAKLSYKVLFHERQRPSKLAAMMRGTMDGVSIGLRDR